MSHSEIYFTWSRLARVLASVPIVLGALVTYWIRRDGGVTSTSLAVTLVSLWIVCCFVYRWTQLRHMERTGTLSQVEFESDPFKFFRGTPTFYRSTVGGGVLIALVVVFASLRI